MSKSLGKLGVLCDTGFLIRLNQPQDPLHANARGYLKHLLSGNHRLYVSTIALAEYAEAGEFAWTIFSHRDQIPAEITQRVIIPNDTKMFAQADVTTAITHYLTADQKCEVVYRLVDASIPMRFQILSLRIPHHQVFGELDLGA